MQKSFRQFYAFLLSIVMVISVFAPLIVFAEGNGDFSYAVLEDGTAQITGYKGTDTVVEIPSEIDGYTVTCIESVTGSTFPGKTVILPATVTAVGEDDLPAFYSCAALENFVVAEDNPAFCAVDGVLFNKEQTKIVCYPSGNPRTSYTVPQGVTTVGEGAFWFSENLTSLMLPDTLVTIEADGIRGCSGLTQIELPKNLRSIGAGAFEKCEKLKSIEIPEGVTEISFGAFWACYALQSVSLPESIVSIGNYAFAACYPLAEINFPEGLQSIGGLVFTLCSNLKSVTLPKSLTSIHSKAFTDSGVTIIYGYSGSLAETHAANQGYTFIPLDSPRLLPTVAKYKSQVRFTSENGVVSDAFDYRLISVISDADWDAFFVDTDGKCNITAVGFIAASESNAAAIADAQAAVENGTQLPAGWKTASTKYIQKADADADAYFGCIIQGIKHSVQAEDIVCSAYVVYTAENGQSVYVWYETAVTAAVATGYDKALAAWLQLNPDTEIPYALNNT